jgi:GT2 family glycosyltransferase
MSEDPRTGMISTARFVSASAGQQPARAPVFGVLTSEGRPVAKGKFIFAGEGKIFIRGVTYGTFRPDANGEEYGDPARVERDFAQMAAHGINAVRIYTMPPRSLLDIAQRYGLRVMVGLSAEANIGYLNDKRGAAKVEGIVRAKMRACAGHPAILCYAIGNEVPASIVRWFGPRRVESYLKRIYQVIKSEDPDGLVTYVNYPSTEYLRLPFLDLVCFNVYLERQEPFEAYLARLQNIAGDRPLVMSEIGLDSQRNGEETQARVLDWQIRATFAAGCAGAFVFSWTDEWYRGGHDVADWQFGLTYHDRRPKPALEAVRRAFAEVPFPSGDNWPRISVIVCSYNGAQTIGDCFDALRKIEYPNFEVIVVNDGSSDRTAAIAKEYGFRLINTENRGLGSARNTGLEAATGEIIAYIDDDAYPDTHWLTYLAATFQSTTHAGVGGPNIAPPGDGTIADCAANSPGGPTHVLLSDSEAEHIPGCNMAFRKSSLQAIGGFDPQFRAAGDDVDLCWRLQQQGWTLGFSPAAVVWHHRRNSVRAYWKQQVGYGKAEAMLERKWPEKYNAAGHLAWAGRLYGKGLTEAISWRRGRIYQGTWGSAPFQSLYQPAAGKLAWLLLMPEWYLIVVGLGVLSGVGILWKPLLFVLPLLALALGGLIVQASRSAARACFRSETGSRIARCKVYGLTTWLHLLQPLARLWGRLSCGLTPWRRRGARGYMLPRVRTFSLWTERWQSPDSRLRSVKAALRNDGVVVMDGGDFDRWDLEVRGGMLGGARMLLAVEEHGAGEQLVRLRVWPTCSLVGPVLTVMFGALSIGAAFDQAWVASMILGLMSFLPALRFFLECAGAMAAAINGFKELETDRR